jgi:hypothetical protein
MRRENRKYLRNTDQGQEGVLPPGYTEIPSSNFPPVIAHVTGLILPVDTGVTSISKIKLSDRRTDDVLAWHLERSGFFSVRSAYQLGQTLQDIPQATASSSNPNGECSLWQKIWKANVPPKVHIYLPGSLERTLSQRKRTKQSGRLRGLINAHYVASRLRIASMLMLSVRKQNIYGMQCVSTGLCLLRLGLEERGWIGYCYYWTNAHRSKVICAC